MISSLQPHALHTVVPIVVAAVWLFHGVYSKVLNGIPRHRLIVARVLGEKVAGAATKAIGLLEALLGVWVLMGWSPIACAVVQTAAIVGMNTLEILLARNLLISASGMVLLNFGFLILIWLAVLFTGA